MKIKLLKSLLFVGAFICFGIIQAQEVSGTISDASGPLPGASVLEKGTTNGLKPILMVTTLLRLLKETY